MKETTMARIRVSRKKKWILFLCFVFGFYMGLHALYAGRVKKGAFYVFSVSGIFLYYSYIIHFLAHNWVTSWLHFRPVTWFAIFTAFGSVVQHIPFLGWTAFFSSYLIYLFAIAVLFLIVDFFSILFGSYKDSKGFPIVSQRYKQKYADKVVYY